MGTAATAAVYTAAFHGTIDQVSRVRREVARYLRDCPVTDDAARARVRSRCARRGHRGA
jgi:hypothetical protein